MMSKTRASLDHATRDTRQSRTFRNTLQRLVPRHTHYGALYSDTANHQQQQQQQRRRRPQEQIEEGRILNLAIISVGVAVISLVLVAVCIKRRRRNSSSLAKAKFFPLRRRKSSSRRSRHGEGERCADLYEDASSTGLTLPSRKVDNDGYVIVELCVDGPSDVGLAGDNCGREGKEMSSSDAQYSQLGSSLQRANSVPSSRVCKAYDHVIVGGSRAVSAGSSRSDCKKKMVTSLKLYGSPHDVSKKSEPKVQNMYDVSVVAKENHVRQEVIDSIYDKLKNEVAN